MQPDHHQPADDEQPSEDHHRQAERAVQIADALHLPHQVDRGDQPEHLDAGAEQDRSRQEAPPARGAVRESAERGVRDGRVRSGQRGRRQDVGPEASPVEGVGDEMDGHQGGDRQGERDAAGNHASGRARFELPRDDADHVERTEPAGGRHEEQDESEQEEGEPIPG